MDPSGLGFGVSRLCGFGFLVAAATMTLVEELELLFLDLAFDVVDSMV